MGAKKTKYGHTPTLTSHTESSIRDMRVRSATWGQNCAFNCCRHWSRLVFPQTNSTQNNLGWTFSPLKISWAWYSVPGATAWGSPTWGSVVVTCLIEAAQLVIAEVPGWNNSVMLSKTLDLVGLMFFFKYFYFLHFSRVVSLRSKISTAAPLSSKISLLQITIW